MDGQALNTAVGEDHLQLVLISETQLSCAAPALEKEKQKQRKQQEVELTHNDKIRAQTGNVTDLLPS